MADTSETRTFDQILATTYDYYRPTLVDNIFKGNPLFYKLMQREREYQDGGASLIFPIMYGKNSTFGWYEDDDPIDLTVQEGITVAKTGWAQAAASVSFTRKQRRMNSGRHQIINLITSKIKQAEMTMYEEFTSALYGTGRYSDVAAVTAASKAMAGLGAIVSETPDSYDVGGIDTDVMTFWRNKVGDDAGTALTWEDDMGDTPALATGPVAMRELYAWCSKGTGGPPDFGVATLAGYSGYEGYMSSKQIYRDPEMAKMGFDNIRFRNMTLFWDEAYTSNSITAANGLLTYAGMMFLNTEFLHFKTDSQTDFIRTEFQRPVNQDTEAALILWMGNLMTSKRSKHGVLAYGNITEIS
jgi:hypothetical protein